MSTYTYENNTSCNTSYTNETYINNQSSQEQYWLNYYYSKRILELKNNKTYQEHEFARIYKDQILSSRSNSTSSNSSSSSSSSNSNK
jgi:hypothetical protein